MMDCHQGGALQSVTKAGEGMHANKGVHGRAERRSLKYLLACLRSLPSLMTWQTPCPAPTADRHTDTGRAARAALHVNIGGAVAGHCSSGKRKVAASVETVTAVRSPQLCRRMTGTRCQGNPVSYFPLQNLHVLHSLMNIWTYGVNSTSLFPHFMLQSHSKNVLFFCFQNFEYVTH